MNLIQKIGTGVGSQARTCFEVFFVVWTRRDQLRKIPYEAPTTENRKKTKNKN